MFLIRYLLKFIGFLPRLLFLRPEKIYLCPRYSVCAYRGALLLVLGEGVPVRDAANLFYYRCLRLYPGLSASPLCGSVKDEASAKAVLSRGGIVAVRADAPALPRLARLTDAPVLVLSGFGVRCFPHRSRYLIDNPVAPEKTDVAADLARLDGLFARSLVEKPRDKKDNPRHSFLYKFVLLTATPLISLLLRPKYFFENGEARLALRHTNRMLIISNHTWWLDPPTLYSVFRRRILSCVAARDVAEKNSFVMKMQTLVNCIFLDRTGFDWSFIRSCVKLLENEGVLLIFPEGRINLTADLLPFMPGTAILAFSTGAPVVPVYIDGSYSLRSRLHIAIGAPLLLDECVPGTGLDSARMSAAGELMRDAMLRLKKSLDETLTDRDRETAARVREKNGKKLAKGR